MSYKLLIKLATRARPNQFLQVMNNIQETIGSDNYEIIISADRDDQTMTNHKIKEKIFSYPNTRIFYGDHINKIHAINRDIEHANPWDFLVNMSDDMRFVQDGWYQKMIDDIKRVWGKSLDFFAHFNDGHASHKLATMSIIGKEYYDRDGYIYHPSYKSVSCDAEAFFVSIMRGRHHYFPQVYFHHNHPANLRQKPDDLYKYNNRFGDQDTENYFARRKKLFYVENPVKIPFNPDKRD